MSWSVNFTGKPDKIIEALEKESNDLTGASKEEFDNALPHLKGLVSLNTELFVNGLLKLEASGHAYTGDKGLVANCTVKIEPVYSVMV